MKKVATYMYAMFSSAFCHERKLLGLKCIYRDADIFIDYIKKEYVSIKERERVIKGLHKLACLGYSVKYMMDSCLKIKHWNLVAQRNLSKSISFINERR